MNQINNVSIIRIPVILTDIDTQKTINTCLQNRNQNYKCVPNFKNTRFEGVRWSRITEGTYNDLYKNRRIDMHRQVHKYKYRRIQTGKKPAYVLYMFEYTDTKANSSQIAFLDTDIYTIYTYS